MRRPEKWSVIITRPERQAQSLAAVLRRRGIEVSICPTIEIDAPASLEPLERAIGRLELYDWIVFTSSNSVERFLGRISVDQIAHASIAAIGPATRHALELLGVNVSIEPARPVAEALAEALVSTGKMEGATVLIPRAAVGREVLPETLRAAGATVDVVEVYRTTVPEAHRDRLRTLVKGPKTLVVCTSSSTVSHFVELAGIERASRASLVCTGPIAARTARELGLNVVEELEYYAVHDVLEAIERQVAG